jgi:hypothetical protein
VLKVVTLTSAVALSTLVVFILFEKADRRQDEGCAEARVSKDVRRKLFVDE